MSDIITSIEAFSQQMPFPPFLSRGRLETYKTNGARFKGTYNEGKYIRIKNLNGGVDRFPIVTENYFRLMTLKLQGLLLNEKPIITVKDNEELTEILNNALNDSDFYKSFLSAYRNFSSLGTGVLYLSYKDGQPHINSINPYNFYKVVSSEDINDITCYVLSQPIYEINYKTVDYTKIKQMRLLYHYKGYYEDVLYNYNENGQLLDEVKRERVETGLSDFAVFCMENCPSSDEVYGKSDYDSVSDIVANYENLFTLINAVLIKNINPILQVPVGVLQENEKTGKLEAPSDGSVVEVDKDAGELKYINYDLQIKDLMSYVEACLNELGIQTEMSKTFLTGEFTSNLSGEAIRALLKAPLDKISREIDEFDDVIKRLFVQVLHLLGFNVEKTAICIVWRDGIDGTSDDNLNANNADNQAITTEIEGGSVNE